MDTVCQSSYWLESECSKLCPTSVLVKNNQRLSYRIQEFNDYLAEKPKEIPLDTWENDETLIKLVSDTEKDQKASRTSYLDALKGAYKKGADRAQLNKSDRDNQTMIGDTPYEQDLILKNKISKKNRGHFNDNKVWKNKSEEQVLNEQMHNNAMQLININQENPPKKPSLEGK